MHRDVPLPLPVPPPTAEERAALHVAGAYFARVRQDATLRLLTERLGDNPRRLAKLSAYLRTGVMLCDELIGNQSHKHN